GFRKDELGIGKILRSREGSIFPCESGTGLWSAAVPAALDRTEKKRRISSLAFPSTTPRRSESKAARGDAAGLPENVGVVGGSMSGKGGAVNMGDLRLAF